MAATQDSMMVERTNDRGSSGRPRLLLLSGTVPGAAGVGEIILRDECNALSPGQVKCIAFVPRNPTFRASRGKLSRSRAILRAAI